MAKHTRDIFISIWDKKGRKRNVENGILCIVTNAKGESKKIRCSNLLINFQLSVRNFSFPNFILKALKV